MARYTGPTCRQCRRERVKLFLKGTKCDTLKCPMERKPYPPGAHGRERLRQGSEYLIQLREKQKARRIYGMLERAFSNLYKLAERQPGVTGENLLRMLELRLDNVVFRARWGTSRSQARQLVSHGHILVNGKRVTIPSYRLRLDDEVTLKETSKDIEYFKHNVDTIDRALPEWLGEQGSSWEVKVLTLPTREQIDVDVHEQLIVELYSK
ncbi:MAG: 30S ribosomal protein S4 [Actinobacteria bacterium]|nr:30S ribosomal protein S4 [Actinomycetota bacterium]MCL6104691.1 30S ribosomal protein S4 [Actinomycetota bacterium]